MLRYALDSGGAGYHAAGASAMGPEDDDVFDRRLRVVDASVMRMQVAGNTQAPTIAVAWIAADLILEDA